MPASSLVRRSHSLFFLVGGASSRLQTRGASPSPLVASLLARRSRSARQATLCGCAATAALPPLRGRPRLLARWHFVSASHGCNACPRPAAALCVWKAFCLARRLLAAHLDPTRKVVAVSTGGEGALPARRRHLASPACFSPVGDVSPGRVAAPCGFSTGAGGTVTTPHPGPAAAALCLARWPGFSPGHPTAAYPFNPNPHHP